MVTVMGFTQFPCSIWNMFVAVVLENGTATVLAGKFSSSTVRRGQKKRSERCVSGLWQGEPSSRSCSKSIRGLLSERSRDQVSESKVRDEYRVRKEDSGTSHSRRHCGV